MLLSCSLIDSCETHGTNSGHHTVFVTRRRYISIPILQVTINGAETANNGVLSILSYFLLYPQFEFSPIILGMMFVINGAVYALSAPCWGFVCDHHYMKPKYVIALGCGFVSGGFLLIGPAPFFEMHT